MAVLWWQEDIKYRAGKNQILVSEWFLGRAVVGWWKMICPSVVVSKLTVMEFLVEVFLIQANGIFGFEYNSGRIKVLLSMSTIIN